MVMERQLTRGPSRQSSHRLLVPKRIGRINKNLAIKMENEHTFLKGLANLFTQHYRGFILVLPPIVFLPIWISTFAKANACMYILMILVVYWISEVIPLGVTSMIPIVLFPVTGIMDTDKACTLYFRDVLVMFVTSIMVAASIEYSKLHVRMALKILKVMGCSPRRLHFGICMATMFMSVWIANAACTAMMCPLIYAVLEQISAQGLVKQYHDADMDLPKPERRPSNLAKCYYLSVAYASSIGGCGSLIGTPTNLAMKGIYEGRFEEATDYVSFGNFMAYSFPIVVTVNITMYLSLEFVFMGLFRPSSQDYKDVDVGPEGEALGKKVIDEKYAELGPLSAHEISVAILFMILIVLYIFRHPGFAKGWADFFEPGIKNSVPTVAIIILLFALPANYKFLKSNPEEARQPTPALLNWAFVMPKVPWGLIFLVGGGAVLAEGSKLSGMATKLGKELSVVEVLPAPVVVLLVTFVAVVVTNVTANVAICNIILPVLIEMAVAMKIHPLYMIYPVGLGCSMAFMLPVGTAPNALVKAYGNLDSLTMIKGGALPSLATVLILWVFGQTWAFVIYPHLSEFPAWAEPDNNDTRHAYPWDQ